MEEKFNKYIDFEQMFNDLYKEERELMHDIKHLSSVANDIVDFMEKVWTDPFKINVPECELHKTEILFSFANNGLIVCIKYDVTLSHFIYFYMA